MGTSLYHEQAANSFSPEIVGNLTSVEPAKQFHDTTRASSPIHIRNFMFQMQRKLSQGHFIDISMFQMQRKLKQGGSFLRDTFFMVTQTCMLSYF